MPYGHADSTEPSDAELLASVRGGDTAGYAVLYQRHHQAARSQARYLVASHTEADDLTSEAFTRVLNAVVAGGGPTEAFRPYLFTTQRRIAYRKYAVDSKVLPFDDLTLIAAENLPEDDPVINELERSLVAQAFARLPKRWQIVLWHTVVAGESPAAVAPLLGMKPNGVSALAYRARQGLRQEYLQAHVNQPSLAPECRAAAENLGAFVREGLSPRDAAVVRLHLSECGTCQTLECELKDMNTSMPAIALLGGTAAASRALAPSIGAAFHHLVLAFWHGLRRHLPGLAMIATILLILAVML